MNNIDIGYLNRKQMNRLMKEIFQSDIEMIESHVLKWKNKVSVVLVFPTSKEQHQFITQSSNLCNDLRRLK